MGNAFTGVDTSKEGPNSAMSIEARHPPSLPLYHRVKIKKWSYSYAYKDKGEDYRRTPA